MADFTIVEATTTHSLPPLQQTIVLEAGDKLSDNATFLAFADNACPTGYRIIMEVNISPSNVEEL